MAVFNRISAANAPLAAIVVATLTAGAGCRQPAETRHHPISGQVVAVDASRAEIVLRHDEIPGFMPAMTMPFKVDDESLLRGRVPGDLVRGTLVVRETSAHLAELTKVGFRPLEPEARAGEARDSTLRAGALVPDATLTDQSARRRRLSEWRGRVAALTFIFTRCPLPEFCPAMDRRFREVQARVKADAALRDHVVLLSISFDPDFDTPVVLSAHAARLGADPSVWLFLTGAKRDVEDLGRSFGLEVIREDDGVAGLTHNLRTVVIDPAGRLVSIRHGADWTAEQLLADMKGAPGLASPKPFSQP
jgi:protein SCO1/2